MNYLRIEGLRVEARIGVYAWEKKIRQALSIDIEIPTDFSQIDDKIERAIDYDALCQHVTQLVQSTQFNLIETVATHIHVSLQSTFQIKAASIRVSKPHAIHNANNICVEIKHTKD